MANIRRRAGKFHTISRALSQDENLSAEAVGVMAYLLSKPDDWEAQLSDIERRFKIGRDKRRRIVRELEDAGYFERNQIRVDGQIDYEIIIHETPLPPHKRTKETTRTRHETAVPETREAQTVTPQTENPSTENTDTYMNIDIQETDIQETEGTLGADAPAQAIASPPQEKSSGERDREPVKAKDPNLQNPVVVLYRDTFHLTPNPEQRSAMVEKVKDPECWQQAVGIWKLNNSNPRNIGDLLDRYNQIVEKKQRKLDQPFSMYPQSSSSVSNLWFPDNNNL